MPSLKANQAILVADFVVGERKEVKGKIASAHPVKLDRKKDFLALTGILQQAGYACTDMSPAFTILLEDSQCKDDELINLDLIIDLIAEKADNFTHASIHITLINSKEFQDGVL